MQEKIVHIPFNRLFFIESQKSFWAASARKVLQRYIVYTVFCLVCAVAIFTDKTVTDMSLPKALIGGCAFYFLVAWMGLFERRIKFLKAVKTHAERYEKETLDGTFIFNDAGIEYKDKEKILQFQWHLLKSVTVMKDNMLIAMKDPAVLAFIVSRRHIMYQHVCIRMDHLV
jgi:hypothetical protein